MQRMKTKFVSSIFKKIIFVCGYTISIEFTWINNLGKYFFCYLYWKNYFIKNPRQTFVYPNMNS